MPSSYFITFRTYGTWLPGDERGWTDRREAGPFSPPQVPSKKLAKRTQEQQNQSHVRLTLGERLLIVRYLPDYCVEKGMYLYGCNALPEHVHLVISSPKTPERTMTQIKGALTKEMRRQNYRKDGEKIWARHGSTVYLFRDSRFYGAMNYLILEQESDKALYIDPNYRRRIEDN